VRQRPPRRSGVFAGAPSGGPVREPRQLLSSPRGGPKPTGGGRVLLPGPSGGATPRSLPAAPARMRRRRSGSPGVVVWHRFVTQPSRCLGASGLTAGLASVIPEGSPAEPATCGLWSARLAPAAPLAAPAGLVRVF
jgi:hypothetical protein